MADPQIKVAECNSAMPFDDSDADLFISSGVYNYSGQSIYVRTNGATYTIPPRPNGNDVKRHVLVKAWIRHGQASVPSAYMANKISHRDQGREFRIEIPVEVLVQGPYFEPHARISMAFENDLAILEQTDPHSSAYVGVALHEITQRFFGDDRSGPVPMLVLANCHNTSINTLYVVINNKICQVRVAHDPDRPETLRFALDNVEDAKEGKSRRVTEVKFDWNNSAVDKVMISNFEWIVGTDYVEVNKALAKLVKEDSRKVSPEVLNAQVTIKSSELEKEIERLNEVIATKEVSIKNQNDRIKALQSELDSANDKFETSTKQQAAYEKFQMDHQLNQDKLEQSNVNRVMSQEEHERKMREMETKYQQMLGDNERKRLADLEDRAYKRQEERDNFWDRIWKGLLAAIPAIVALVGVFFQYKTAQLKASTST